jgi:esterase/lipase superfamily enzyme
VPVPDAFGAVIAMSGTYRLQRFFDGQNSADLYFSSPLDFLPGLDGPQLDGAQLDVLRQRFAILASGQGAWEDIGESWAVADVLGREGVPNRVDPWAEEWPTWRRMLPHHLGELC